MATEADLNQDDDQKDDQSQPLATGGGSAAPDVGSSPSAGAPTTNRAAPTSRPNIQQYINANSNAGQNLATGISNQNSRQTDQFNNQVSKTNDQLNKQSQPLQNNLGENGSNLIQQSFKDPSAILKNEDQLGQFSKLRDQGYQGDISNLQANGQQAQNQLQSSLGSLQGAASNAGTESGRFQLLRNSLGQPNYSNGQQKLDQLFLQTQPGASAGLQQNLTNNANTASNQLKSSSNDFQNRLNALNNLSSQDSKNINDLFINGNGANGPAGLNQINTDVTAQQAKLADLKNQIPDYTKALASNSLTPDQIKTLGITGNLGTEGLYGADLSKYITQATPDQIADPTMSQAANQDQIDRYSALNGLLNNTQNDPFGAGATAGGYNPFQFNQQGAQAAVDQAASNADQRTNEYVTQLLGQIPGYAAANSGFQSADPGADIRAQTKSKLAAISSMTDPSAKAQALHDWFSNTLQSFGSTGVTSPQQFAGGFQGGQDALNYVDQFNKLKNQTLGSGKV